MNDVSVQLTDLLADPALRLRPLTSHCHEGPRPIRWVASTELPDPLPFLRAGELMLTTAMLERSRSEWDDLLHRLAALPVAGLGFGTGLVHREVPGYVVERAEHAGLALFGSPVEVPFVQISRWVADRVFAERYAQVRRTADVQDALLRELLSGRGLPGLLRRLHGHLDAGAVSVTAPDGRLLARHPAAPEAPAPGTPGTPGTPITVDGVPVARLATERATARQDLLSFAASVLGLEVARQQAVLTGRRELLGQVVEDVVHRTVPDAEARRRLAAHGIDPAVPHAVVLARVPAGPARLRALPWTLGPLLDRGGDVLPTALVEDSVAVFVPEGVDADATAHTVLERLRAAGPGVRVGVGARRPGVAGLRLGWFEARQAGSTGAGVRTAAPLSLTGLLLGNLDLPLRELGDTVLAPLLRYDAEHGGELLRTLRTYLAHDARPASAAEALTLHRNSLRHRLRRIEELTGRSLDRLDDRMELWLALHAREAGGEATG
ncbi:helix-turn-helix domain-containing protein [Streptomyces sp. NPDC006684]|uniref:PucR family transcriptional regulator n=2 Tax=Streptomyces TaxID=1883 RepID=UPI003453CA5B